MHSCLHRHYHVKSLPDVPEHACLDMSRAVIWQVSAPWAEKDLHHISKLYVQDGAAASNALHDKVEG